MRSVWVLQWERGVFSLIPLWALPCVCSYPLCMLLILFWELGLAAHSLINIWRVPCPGSGGSWVRLVLSSCGCSQGSLARVWPLTLLFPEMAAPLVSGSPAQGGCWMTRWSGFLPARGGRSVWHWSYNLPPSRHIQWHDLTPIRAGDAHRHIHTQVFTVKVCNGCCSVLFSDKIIFLVFFLFLFSLVFLYWHLILPLLFLSLSSVVCRHKRQTGPCSTLALCLHPFPRPLILLYQNSK